MEILGLTVDGIEVISKQSRNIVSFIPENARSAEISPLVGNDFGHNGRLRLHERHGLLLISALNLSYNALIIKEECCGPVPTKEKNLIMS